MTRPDSPLPAIWAGLFRDTSALTDSALLDAALAGVGGPVGSVAVSEDELADVLPGSQGVSVHARGGAGVIGGIARLATRHRLTLAGIEVSLREEADLAANARRVLAALEAARTSGDLDHEVPIHLVLPPGPATYGWLGAADVAGEAELGLGLRIGTEPDPSIVIGWIDAALDRELGFVAVDGPTSAVRCADGRPGFANLLLATGALWDGDRTEAVRWLSEDDPDSVTRALAERGDDLLSARRWVHAIATPTPSTTTAALEQILNGAL